MSAALIDVNQTDDRRDVVHRAVQSLAEGKLVVFPTETVYGLAASALDEGAVARLSEIKQRGSNPLTLAIKSADDALDYVPDLSPLGRRLARRCWPGPLTLVVPDSHPESLLTRLPESVRQATIPQGTVGLRVPAHSLLLDVLQMLAGPLVLTSANLSNQPEATSGTEAFAALGEHVDLVLDEGSCQFGQSSSVIRLNDNRLKILREGVISPAHLKRLAGLVVVFVCTGNTCRSPMAEAIGKRILAERMGCTESELEDQGVLVTSAGVAAVDGSRPSVEAVMAMQEQNLDLSAHSSQPLHDRIVRHADLLLTMTHGHRQAVVTAWPEAAERTLLLSDDGKDVSDPIGGPIEVYRACARQIEQAIAQRIDQLDLTPTLHEDH